MNNHSRVSWRIQRGSKMSKQMENYVGQSFEIYAGLRGEESLVNDHVEIIPIPRSEEYEVIFRSDCDTETGIWNNKKEGTGHLTKANVDKETALKIGKEVAEKEGIVLLLNNIFIPGERPVQKGDILYHPKGWKPNLI